MKRNIFRKYKYFTLEKENMSTYITPFLTLGYSVAIFDDDTICVFNTNKNHTNEVFTYNINIISKDLHIKINNDNTFIDTLIDADLKDTKLHKYRLIKRLFNLPIIKIEKNYLKSIHCIL